MRRGQLVLLYCVSCCAAAFIKTPCRSSSSAAVREISFLDNRTPATRWTRPPRVIGATPLEPFSGLSRSSVTLMAAGKGSGEGPAPPASSLGRTVVFLAAWLSFVGYAFFVAPGNTEAARALDMSMLKELIANPLSTTITPLFVSIFNALGVMPIVYALLLLPGSKGQPLPTGAFCLASFFLGFFALGPYLAFRTYRPVPALPETRWLVTAVESRIPAALAFVGAIYVLYLGVLGGGPLDLASRWSEYVSLFQSQMFVHVSSLDLLILSLFVVDPLREDMVRRGWTSSSKLLAFASVPVLGPALYLVLRPPIVVDDEEEEDAKRR